MSLMGYKSSSNIPLLFSISLVSFSSYLFIIYLLALSTSLVQLKPANNLQKSYTMLEIWEVVCIHHMLICTHKVGDIGSGVQMSLV